ncbi:hypothetical protein LIA77_02535 [Sarocladium implicatum]|nr:hypothetical protein LIA77_02535 [Sarocladium implicatum]
MPRGRPRRRYSSSSVETVNLDNATWLEETSVLKAAPKDEHPDKHIVFEVKDMTFFDPSNEITHDGDHQTYPNVLEVCVKGPFRARGTLVYEDERSNDGRQQLKRSRIAKPQGTHIEIQKVHQFTIGETADRQPCIWALGRCGAWFEIKPSVQYKAVYDTMAEAVFLYYRIVDFYGFPKERASMQGNPSEIKLLFYHYASAVGDGSTYEDVVERCSRHALFLCYQFEYEKEYTVPPDNPKGQRTAWHTTEIYKWLKKHGNGALQTVQQALKKPLLRDRESSLRRQDLQAKTSPVAATSTEQAKKRSSSEDDTSDSAESDTGIRESKPVVGASGNMNSFKRASSQSTIEENAPSAARSGSFVATDPQNMGERDHAALRSLVEAVKAVATLRKGALTRTGVTQLLYAKYKFPDMRFTGNYRKGVEEVFHYYAKALLQDPAFQVFQSTEMYEWIHEMSSQPFTYTNMKADRFPFFCVPREKRKRQDDEAVRADSSDLIDEDHPRSQRATPVAGKRLPGRPSKSALSIMTPSRKRPFDEITAHSDDDSDNRRSMYFEEGDESMDDAEERPAPVSYGEPVDFVLRAKPLPSWVSKRLDGAWVCDRNGCDFVVRGDAEAEARERILKHIDGHAPLACGREGCDFTVDEEDDDVARLRMGQHTLAQHGPYVCNRDGCDFIARQERGIEEERRVKAHIAEHEKQDQKLLLARSESRPHLPIEYETPTPLPRSESLLTPHDPAQPTRPPSRLPLQALPQAQSLSAALSLQGMSKLRLAPDTRSKFRKLLQHFTRTPRPVSDKLANMDVLQSLAREDKGPEPTDRGRGKWT